MTQQTGPTLVDQLTEKMLDDPRVRKIVTDLVAANKQAVAELFEIAETLQPDTDSTTRSLCAALVVHPTVKNAAVVGYTDYQQNG